MVRRVEAGAFVTRGERLKDSLNLLPGRRAGDQTVRAPSSIATARRSPNSTSPYATPACSRATRYVRRSGQAPDGQLDAVQERVHRRRTTLGPVREAVAAPAPVVGRQVDGLWRATLDHLGLDAPAFQRAVDERRCDRRPGLSEARRASSERRL